ncbi:MAG: hypothetical protein WBG70_18685 [Spirulinaceae cyanobacterium]
MNDYQVDKIRGIIFGQAVGDALGFGTEWISKQRVVQEYPQGLNEYSTRRNLHRLSSPNHSKLPS